MLCRIELTNSLEEEYHTVVYLPNEIVLDKRQPLIILCNKQVSDLFIYYWLNYYNPKLKLEQVRDPTNYKQLMTIKDIEHSFYDKLTTQELIMLTQPAKCNNMRIMLKELLIVISDRFSQMSISDTAKFFGVEYMQNDRDDKNLKLYKEINNIIYDVIVE